MDDLRFGGIARLYGVEGLERLARAHVAVVGIGGVGSWAAEALARSGVGEISLFDLDDVYHQYQSSSAYSNGDGWSGESGCDGTAYSGN